VILGAAAGLMWLGSTSARIGVGVVLVALAYAFLRGRR
jgi:hypothetical protein